MSHGEHVHLTEVGQDDHEDCDSGADGDADDNDEHGPMVGGLILRENHCVLIRSLTGEWDGMRLPWAAADKDEASTDAALRIASELCEIETNQIRILEDLAPVTVAVPGMPILIHALYAVDPPPADFVPDIEDPEDVYDWYTFPRAMSALAKDPYARAALVTMACALAAASGIVPTTGGIFGQEWTIPAFRMLPDPGLPSPGEMAGAEEADASASSQGHPAKRKKTGEKESDECC